MARFKFNRRCKSDQPSEFFMARSGIMSESHDDIIQFLDGKLGDLKQAFASFDKKAKGVIPLKCLGLLLRSLGFNPTESEVDDLMNEADIDGSGTLDFIEFLHLMSYIWKQKAEQTIRSIFEVYDLDGNGTIDAEELLVMMTEFGYDDFTERDSLEMIAMADIDGNGQIDIEEFSLMLGDTADV